MQHLSAPDESLPLFKDELSNSGFNPLGLRHDDPAEPEAARAAPQVALTMPRVRLASADADAASLPDALETGLWTRMQAAARLARAGDGKAALGAFEAVVRDVDAHPPRAGLDVLGAKAAYNRAVLFEKMFGDLANAESAMEALHDRHGLSVAPDARVVAARAGLHAARLAAVSGRMTIALARYRERLGRFRDALPPAELQVFNADYLRQRSRATRRGFETTARMSTLTADSASARESGASKLELHALEARLNLEIKQAYEQASAEIDAMRAKYAALQERFNENRLTIQQQQDRLVSEMHSWREESRADMRRRLRLLRSDMLRMDAVQKRDRRVLLVVLIAAAGALGVAMFMFQHTLNDVLAQLAR